MSERDLSDFKMEIRHTIGVEYHESFIFDSSIYWRQGIPNLLIVYHGRAAFLECEISLNAKAKYRVNKERMITQIRRDGGFAAFINPKNKKDVLYELYVYLDKARR